MPVVEYLRSICGNGFFISYVRKVLLVTCGYRSTPI